MPTVSLIVFSFLLEMVEGIGTAMYGTATFTLLTQLYPDKKGLVAVSILSQCLFAVIGASLSEPHTSDLNGGFFIYI